MILDLIRQENWYEIMVLFLAVAYSQRKERTFFFNGESVAKFITEKKNIECSRWAVNACVKRMCEENYVKLIDRQQLSKKKTLTLEEYYKTNNIYAHADLNAINEDLKQYWYGPGIDWLANSYELMKMWFEFSNKYGIIAAKIKETSENTKESEPNQEAENTIETDPKKLKAEAELESMVNRRCLEILNENNIYISKQLANSKTYIPKNYYVSYLEEGKLRASNGALCSTKNPENSVGDKEREKLLTPYLGKDFEEFDINCCVPRLQRDLLNDNPTPFYKYDNKGEILLDTQSKPVADDIYERIYNRAGFNQIWDIHENINGIWEEITGEPTDKKITIRKIIKDLTLPLFMREGSYGYSTLKYHDWIKSNMTNSRNKMFRKYFCLEILFDLPITVIQKKWKNAMHEELSHPQIGITQFLKADIFFYESNLEIIMVNTFNKMGIRCLNVYDGFYFSKGTVTPELFYEVYTQALNYLKQLMKDYNEPIEKRLKKAKIVAMKEKDYKMPSKPLVEELRKKFQLAA